MSEATLTYGEYVARIEHDESSGTYFGCVINLSNPITFMASDEGALQGEFRKAVQDYLDDCKARGEVPETPSKV